MLRSRVRSRVVAAVVVSTFASAAPSSAAPPLDEADRAAIRETISKQRDAIDRDDAAAAFALAAPSIRELFGAPDRFLAMVKDLYAPLYRPRSFFFLELEIVGGEYTQKALVVGRDGEPRIALYLMDRRPDGWKVLGCVLRPEALEVVRRDPSYWT